ncbi:MAG: SRPBCC family protein [Candidatus Acidiferrales bacterium]
MSIRKEASGRRSVQAEAELPGTPEQVWQAIATGPGVSAWFCPTEIEMGSDGKPARLVFDMGPGMQSAATVTAWDPPRRFAAESVWAPNMPPVATEWTVEARAGGTCLVRVMHSLFASTDDWDNQLESTETGWPGFFRILRLYLSHYAGQRCFPMRAITMVAGDEDGAWQKLSRALGLASAAAGQKKSAPAGVPPFSGTVEHVDDKPNAHGMLLRLHGPAPGTLAFGTFNCGGMVLVSVGFFLYGDATAAVAKRDEPSWQAWMQKQFPAASEANAGAG